MRNPMKSVGFKNTANIKKEHLKGLQMHFNQRRQTKVYKELYQLKPS